MKLIAIGFNTFGTGLTRVMHSILRRLASRHEIHYLASAIRAKSLVNPG